MPPSPPVHAESLARPSKRPTRRRTRAQAIDLRGARQIGDPPADALFAKLRRERRLSTIDDSLALVVTNGDPYPDALPVSVRAFLDDNGLPAWACRSRLLRAQRFAERHAVGIACALFCAALPLAFTGAKGVSVLVATGRLASDVDRRVNETGRFVFDVLMPGGFEPTGRAIRSAQKVRLLHASVRQLVASKRRGRARASQEDIPINQEDLLGTLTCFSVVVLDALRSLGVRPSASEAEDFIHLWRVVGALSGIREAWLPNDLTQARHVGDAIRARQSVASADGRELARVLVDGIERHLPARGLRVLAPSLLRHFLGDRAGHLLGLTDGMRERDLAAWLSGAASLASRIGARLGAAESALPKLGRAVIEHVLARKLGPRPPSFARPLSAAQGCPYHLPLAAKGPR